MAAMLGDDQTAARLTASTAAHKARIAEELWDEDRRLVCHATQLMLIRLVDPESVGAGPRKA